MQVFDFCCKLLFRMPGITEYYALHTIATGLFLICLQKRGRMAARLLAAVFVQVSYCLVGSLLWVQDSAQLAADYNLLWYVGAFPLNAVLGKWICAISWNEALYCSANGLFVEHLASSIFIYIFSASGRIAWGGVVYYGVYLVIYSFVYFTVAKRLHEDGRYVVSRTTVLISSIAGVAITTLLSAQIKKVIDPVSAFNVAEGPAGALLQLFQIYSICFCVLMLAIQLLHHRDILAQKKVTIIQTLWKQRKEQYQISKENIELINRKCHDMKHQIAALMQMEDGSIKRERFIKEVQDMIEIYDTDVDSGSEALDTLLIQYSLSCKMRGIQWTGMADGTVLSFMDEMDLYTLLGNAFDNAIESVERMDAGKNRIIQFQIGRKDYLAVIQIENSFNNELVMQDGFPVSSKADSANHGFGLRSISTIAEKYHGSATVKAGNGIFALSVVIPITEEG